MWVNPKVAQTEQPARSAPEPSGRPLATFPRPGRGRAADAELRVTLDAFEGHQYVSVRLWERGSNGFYPSRKGCSIRLGEAEDMAAALLEAVKLAHAVPARLPTAGKPQRSRPRSSDQVPPSRERARPQRTQDAPLFSRPPGAVPTSTYSSDFDEFAAG